ncbi:hypothetical protein Ahy_A03g013524 isoform B [Arachis hypogaea]|uniref:Uncharacterized protein n=1 Tax=Arachis hypogaea TaxID=3818 RepID=A0A445DVV6_ARAHY|nr:hypothetical protein Ahy_A03g013524 isoform B [Arachis hypogaea]
MEILLTRPFPL